MQLAAVYSRTLPDGRILRFAASGWTYDNTFVLYDFQTESLWYHLGGRDELTCIAGELADTSLPEHGAVMTRWSTWVDDHPGSLILLSPR